MRISIIVLLVVASTVFVGEPIKGNMLIKEDQIDQSKTAPNKWGAVSEGFELYAQVEPVAYQPGQPVLLKLIIRNSTGMVLTLVETGPEKDYRLIIKDGRGRDVPLTKYGENLMRNVGTVKREVIKVSPRQELNSILEVHKIYEIAPGNTYFITARRNVFKQNGKGLAEVVSNTVQVKVTK
jgi:hypothetical protein